MNEERNGATLAGAARWLSVHDDLLRGLTHALSNRVGTISAASYLLDQQPSSPGEIGATLLAESERLETLLQLMRMLPYPEGAVAEPVIPTDATTNAVALQSHHNELREIPVTVTLDGDVQPAYVNPAALTLAVAVAIGAAQRAAGSGGRVELVVSSSADTVSIDARAVRANRAVAIIDNDADNDAARDIEAITWLLAPYRGYGDAANEGMAAIVPTLQAARRARQTGG